MELAACHIEPRPKPQRKDRKDEALLIDVPLYSSVWVGGALWEHIDVIAGCVEEDFSYLLNGLSKTQLLVLWY